MRPLPPNPRVVVTGAGSGLGRALCVVLARRGARLVVTDVDEPSARATAELVAGSAAMVARCDVRDAAALEALARDVERALGGVDLLVNNAGVAVAGPMEQVTLDDWRYIVDVNLWGVVHGCRAFVPMMKASRRGHVLNVASSAGLVSAPQMSPYTATKAAVVALSESLAAELAPEGVGVSVLCPTFFTTNIARSARGVGSLEPMRDAVERLMSRASVQAEDVARSAIAGVEAGRLYVLPHRDGRWMWRAKRTAPELFAKLAPRLFKRVLARLGVSI